MKNANAKPTTYVNVNDGTPSISTIDAPTTMSEVCLLMRRVADTLEAAIAALPAPIASQPLPLTHPARTTRQYAPTDWLRLLPRGEEPVASTLFDSPKFRERYRPGGTVEFHCGSDGETPYPVEFKRGMKKPHRADEVQLCAQGLCLEEMTGRRVPEGALFYGETRRRVVVIFDEELRRLTEETAAAVKGLFVSGRTPPAEYEPKKCRACSLLDLCRPKAGARSAAAWREREVRSALAEAPESSGA